MDKKVREGGIIFFFFPLFNVETFSLFNSKGQLVVEFLVRFIMRKIDAIETRRGQKVILKHEA